MKHFYFLLSLISISANAQDINLNISSGNSIYISANNSVQIHGMELSPSAAYTLTENIITKSATPINANSINRVYNVSSPLLSYQGNLVFNYEDTELNGVSETNLVMLIKDSAGNWNATGSVLNTTLNTLTNIFASTIDIYGVTASDNISLNITEFDNINLNIYPNPVLTNLTITFKNPIDITFYDIAGNLILNTNNTSIDVSHLSSGVYFLKIIDLNTNKQTYKKIIKD